MTMSSSAAANRAAVSIVQSGIVAWEDPVPVADWRYKTVTLIGLSLSIVATILLGFIASRPCALRRIFRVLFAPIPPSATEGQVRGFLAQLAADPPGFLGTNVTVVDDVCCVVSELREPGAMDVEFLTDYRHCALVGTANIRSAPDLGEVVRRGVSDLGGCGLVGLLQAGETAAVIRVLDLDSHAAFQVMGPSQICDEAVRFFDGKQIRRVHDVRRISEEIRRLSA